MPDKNPQIKNVDKAFKKKRRKILNYLKSDIKYDRSAIPRPFIIEITGSPHSGKTTTITELDKFLRRHGFRVLRPQEGGETIRHIDRTTPIYNIRTGLYALTNLLDNIHGHNYDVIIYDRGIFDSYCWMSYWADRGKITKKHLINIQEFMTMDLWSREIDLSYFMICDPQKAREREFNTSLSKELNTKNVEVLKLYRKTYNHLSKRFPQLKLLDTTNLKPKEATEKIALEILAMMDQKLKIKRPR